MSTKLVNLNNLLLRIYILLLINDINLTFVIFMSKNKMSAQHHFLHNLI